MQVIVIRRLAALGAIASSLTLLPGASYSDGETTFPAPAYYVSFPNVEGGQLAIVDPATAEIRGFVKLPGVDDGGITDLYAAPAKPVIYAIANNGSNLYVFNTNVLKVRHVVAMPKPITGLAISPSGDLLYGFDAIGPPPNNDIFVIANDAVSATIALPAGPGGVTVANGGRDIFASMPRANSILVIDRNTNVVERTVFLGSCTLGTSRNPCDPFDLTTSVDSKYVIASCWRNAVVLDAATDQIVKKVPLADSDGGIVAVDRFSNTAWLVARGAWFGLTMDPPFSTTSITRRGHAYSLAFQSAGVGVGLEVHDNNFFLDKFTASGGFVRTTKVFTFPETIVFSP